MTSRMADFEHEPLRLDIKSVAEARAAFDAHQALRPECGTPGFSAWCDKKRQLQTAVDLAENHVRSRWSTPFIVPGKIPPTPIPSPQEKPMTPPTTNALEPREQIQSLLAKLTAATREAAAASCEKDYKHTLSQIYQYRSQVRRLEAQAGLDPHDLPAIPANPWKNPASPMPEPAPVPQEPAPAPVETLRTPREMTARQSIASIRRSIWLLMADLEQMPPEGRGSLADDLGLLDAAAHAAVCLAAGKLEIA